MPTPRHHATTVLGRNGAQRAAFTLLEILLALGLSVVLLVALNSALELYRKFTTAGRADIEQAQLVRALMQKISADIRCVVAPPKTGGAASSSTTSSSTSSSSSSSSSSGSTSSSSNSSSSNSSGSSSSGSSSTGDNAETPPPIEVVDPSAAYSKEVVGVLGDPQSLVLTVARPTRSNAGILAVDELATTSDLKSISYFLVQQGADGLRGIVAEQLAQTGTSLSANGQPGGLARLEGDRLAISKADTTSNLETLAQRTKVLAPEVNYLQFRYFDGLLWYETWDSTTDGLPRAVEITIGFPPAEDAAEVTKSSTYGSTANLSTDLYRLVVAIPTSEPLTSLDEF